MAASSRPRPSLVTRLEPTLTTMRRASRSSDRRSIALVAGRRVAVRSADRRASARLLATCCACDVLVDRRAPACSQPSRVERRDLEHRALPAQALDEVLDARLALVGRHHVELVQHQPARLVVQRRGRTSSARRRSPWPARPGRRRRRTARSRRRAAAGACAAGGAGTGGRGPRLRPRLRSGPECRRSTKLCSGPTRTTPRFGCSVVNG